MFRILFYQPEIPPNTGNAIRLAANSGCELHLVEPLGFTLEESHLRRAGLDYHDLARVRVHASLAAAWEVLLPAKVYAFTTTGSRRHTEITYAPGDVLMFGPESAGLPPSVRDAPEVTERVRLPMMPNNRSLNLANTTAIAVYEAWRQHDFAGS